MDASAWSAIAAFLSLFVACLMLIYQSRTYREQARPELIISDFKRTKNERTGNDQISFSRIKNVGKGSALHMSVNSFHLACDDRATAIMASYQSPIVSIGEEVVADCSIDLFWQHITGKPGSKSISIPIDILCWDTTGVRYHTKYYLHASEILSNNFYASEVADKLMLGARSVVIQPVWLLKFKQKLKINIGV